MRHRSSFNGFHLIEILIAIAIISIIAMIGVPLYSGYIQQEQRLEAAGMLTKLAIAMEERHLAAHSYSTASLQELGFPEYIVKDQYRLSIQSSTDTDYTLAASPTHQQDEKCGTLFLDASGRKSISGSATIDECW